MRISNTGYIDAISTGDQYWSAIISTNTTGLHFAYVNSYKNIGVCDIYKLASTSPEIEANEDSKTITIRLPNSSNQGFIILVGNPVDIVTRN